MKWHSWGATAEVPAQLLALGRITHVPHRGKVREYIMDSAKTYKYPVSWVCMILHLQHRYTYGNNFKNGSIWHRNGYFLFLWGAKMWPSILLFWLRGVVIVGKMRGRILAATVLTIGSGRDALKLSLCYNSL